MWKFFWFTGYSILIYNEDETHMGRQKATETILFMGEIS
jgi:hypothetical protein